MTTVTTVTGFPIISFHTRARVANYRDKPVTLVTVVTPPSAPGQDRHGSAVALIAIEAAGPWSFVADRGDLRSASELQPLALNVSDCLSDLCGVPLLGRLAAQEVRNNVSTRGGADRLRSRLGEIADELEQTHKELDAKRELIKVQPTLDAKQPYSRAAMKVFERLRDLYALARGAADRKPVTPRGVVSKPACKAPRTAPAGPYVMGSNS